MEYSGTISIAKEEFSSTRDKLEKAFAKQESFTVNMNVAEAANCESMIQNYHSEGWIVLFDAFNACNEFYKSIVAQLSLVYTELEEIDRKLAE